MNIIDYALEYIYYVYHIIPVKQCMAMILVADLGWFRVSVVESLQATRATLVTRQQLLQKQSEIRWDLNCLECAMCKTMCKMLMD